MKDFKKQDPTRVKLTKIEWIKLILGFIAFILILGLVGRLDYNEEMRHNEVMKNYNPYIEVTIEDITFDSGATLHHKVIEVNNTDISLVYANDTLTCIWKGDDCFIPETDYSNY